jgi:hypothetical protein
MQQGFSKGEMCSGGQDVLRFYGTRKSICIFVTAHHWTLNLNQLHQTLHFFQIHFNIISPFTKAYSYLFRTKCLFSFQATLSAWSINVMYLFYAANRICWSAQIVNLFTKNFLTVQPVNFPFFSAIPTAEISISQIHGKGHSSYVMCWWKTVLRIWSWTFLIVLLEHNNTHTYIHTHTHTYINTYIYTHTYVRTYVPTYINKFTYTYVYTNIHKYIHTYEHTYKHECIHTYIHTYTRHLFAYHLFVAYLYIYVFIL